MQDPYKIAAWRFEQIAFLLDPSLSEALRRAALRKRCTQAVEWPGSEERERCGKPPIKKSISKTTLYRWEQQYRQHGYDGLLPRIRCDHGASKHESRPVWVSYAIGLLYENPERSLTQLSIYLSVEFPDYGVSRSTLNRWLLAHPAYAGIQKLRGDKESRLRDLYEAQYPHECWQLDGKGKFWVRFKDGTRIEVTVLTILDDHSRYVLAVRVAITETANAAIQVFEIAVCEWGLPDRMQFDRGTAFDSHAFRQGVAHVGAHRNFIKPKNPEADGKIEAYHRALNRWFVKELRAQEVVDLEHLQQLLEAMIAQVYNRHHHRSIGTTPEKRLAGRKSSRLVSKDDLVRSFFVQKTAKSHPKTGEVNLPNGRYRVPAAFAGKRSRFRYHPVHTGRAVLVAGDGSEIVLQLFEKKPLSAIPPRQDKRGAGQLQKLLDVFRGQKRPNAEMGFGIPEVFRALETLVGRPVPKSEREAYAVQAFYRKYGPLARDPFLAACRRAKEALGKDRPLSAYLDHIERQIAADNNKNSSSETKGE